MPAARLLGIDWSGIFGHEGWAVYDNFTSATQQQCIAHVLRRCNSLIETRIGDALAFPRGVKVALLRGFACYTPFSTQQNDRTWDESDAGPTNNASDGVGASPEGAPCQ